MKYPNYKFSKRYWHNYRLRGKNNRFRKMLNKEQEDEVSDTTKMSREQEAGTQEI